MPLQATGPACVVNVPDDFFYMAGFEVTLHGRFWVTPEVFEDYCRLFASRHANFNDEASYLKLGQDGMQFAVDWIHSYCDNPTRNNKLDLDSKVYVAAGHLHEAAIRYSLIWDLMAQLYRGTAIGDRVKNDR